MPILGILASSTRVAAGDFESIATVNITSNGQSATFSSIASTWTHLQIRIMCRGVDTGTLDTLYMRFNGLAPSGGYRDHYLRGDGASATAGTGSNNFLSVGNVIGNGNTASAQSAWVIDILDYANTNKYKTVRSLGGYDGNGNGRMFLTSGFLTTTTNAITDIDISTLAGGFVANSTIALYGIKSA